MKWQERTDRAYKGHVEDALFPGQLKHLLLGRIIAKVGSVEGKPGGANNDQLTLTLDDGTTLQVDAYSGGNMYVTVTEASKCL